MESEIEAIIECIVIKYYAGEEVRLPVKGMSGALRDSLRQEIMSRLGISAMATGNSEELHDEEVVRKFNGTHIKELQQALESAFDDKMTLRIFVETELNEEFDLIVGGTSRRDIIFGLIKWARSRGRLAEFIRKAYNSNPGNPELRHFALQYLKLQVSTEITSK